MSQKSAQKKNAFLDAMSLNEPDSAQGQEAVKEPAPAQVADTTKRIRKKHIGGYLSQATVEKVALLRARLGKDNSQLLELAIDDLYRKHDAQRAYGDA